MRFLLDESAELRIAAFLRASGHDVTSIAENHPRSLPDDQVLAIASAERRILITNDRDFGELIFRRGLAHCGVIYLRLSLGSSAAEKIERLRHVLQDYADRLDRFIVVTIDTIRLR